MEEYESVGSRIRKIPYTGTIYHKPKGGCEVAIGAWVNGVINYDSNDSYQPNKKISGKENQRSDVMHRTKREVSLKQRFEILKRDNFKCCVCGASPAKDPNIELHIDHIIPWSKGGETISENLQTLCSNCNIGKSDSI